MPNIWIINLIHLSLHQLLNIKFFWYMGALVEVRENGFVLEAEGRRLWVTLKEKAGNSAL